MRKALAGAVVLLSLITTFAFLFAAPASAIEQTVDIRDNVFDPATKTINVGDTVRWTNRGTNTHNVTFDSPLGTNLGDTTSNTSSVSPAFNTAGTFTYFCRFHQGSGMRGTIVVGGGGVIGVGAPRISSNATSIPAGGSITVTGTGFPASSGVDVSVNNVVLASPTTDASGNFSSLVAIPATAPPGTYPITAAVKGNPSVAAPPLSLSVTAAGTTVTTAQAGTVVTTTPTTLAVGSALPPTLPGAIPPGASSAVVSGPSTARTGANDGKFLNLAAVALALGTLLVMVTPKPGRHVRRAFSKLR